MEKAGRRLLGQRGECDGDGRRRNVAEDRRQAAQQTGIEANDEGGGETDLDGKVKEIERRHCALSAAD
jgi:hypothetical protein